MEKGLIQIYTGNGKGKTTAALGVALRALGHDLKVYIIQFMKNRKNSGEVLISEKIPNLTIFQTGLSGFVKKGDPQEEDIILAEKSLELAKEISSSGDCNILILDEAITALSFNLIKTDELLDLLKNKSEKTELILTGRDAPPEIIAQADLVTEMKEIKHYYSKGIQARKGIEY